MAKDKITIATRGSKLALWQAEHVASLIKEKNPGLTVEIKKIKTTGDKIQDVPLAKVGGKGLFLKEIEEAMLAGEADLAVHSMKDVPTELPDGLHISAVLKRDDPRDVFISKDGTKFMDLPNFAKVGTSSLRRQCQLLAAKMAIKIVPLRGNLDTRIRKLDEGEVDAIVLAYAGVKRLGFEERITEVLSFETCIPAIGQGAVAIECRKDDTSINELTAPLNHEGTAVCVGAERAFLKKLEGGCQVPIAAHAYLEEGKIIVFGMVGNLTGDWTISAHDDGPAKDFELLGTSLAENLLSMGAGKILAEVYGENPPS